MEKIGVKGLGPARREFELRAGKRFFDSGIEFARPHDLSSGCLIKRKKSYNSRGVGHGSPDPPYALIYITDIKKG